MVWHKTFVSRFATPPLPPQNVPPKMCHSAPKFIAINLVPVIDRFLQTPRAHSSNLTLMRTNNFMKYLADSAEDSARCFARFVRMRRFRCADSVQQRQRASESPSTFLGWGTARGGKVQLHCCLPGQMTQLSVLQRRNGSKRAWSR